MHVVRPARLRDARAIAQLHARSWQHAAMSGVMPKPVADSLNVQRESEAWLMRLRRDDERTWVSEGATQLIGFARAGHSRDHDTKANTGELYSIHVDPSAWGSGVSAALMHEVESWLKASGHHAITLWVLRDNERAQAFYKRLGYRPDGQMKKRSFAGETCEELRFIKRVQSV